MNWGTVIDPCQSNLACTQNALQPLLRMVKTSMQLIITGENDFAVLLIPANSITYVCPMIEMLECS